MRIATTLTAIAFSAWAILGSTEGAGAGSTVDFARYAASSATLSAVATAVSLVEPCSGTIGFAEEIIESYDVAELTVSCTGGDGGSKSVILRFDMLDGGKLRPASFGTGG